MLLQKLFTNIKQLDYNMHALVISYYMVLQHLILSEPFRFWISVLLNILYLWDINFISVGYLYMWDILLNVFILTIYCHYVSWSLSHYLLDDKFETLYSMACNFSSSHKTCVGQHLAHSRHWHVGVHDVEVCIRTLIASILPY